MVKLKIRLRAVTNRVHCSPPVVLSNFERKHQVVYLDTDEEWRYATKVQDCESFAAAIHFADVLNTSLNIFRGKQLRIMFVTRNSVSEIA